MSAPSGSRRRLAGVVDGVLEATVIGSFSRIGISARRALYRWDDVDRPGLDGRIALVTGASSGLGLASAHGLAALGATVVLLGRDRARTDEARAEVAKASGRHDVSTVIADLSDVQQSAGVVHQLRSRFDQLDVLVHNAGTLTHAYTRTRDHLELTAQTHVLAPFLLNASLLPLLQRSRSGRVITVSSGGMYTARLDTDALDGGSPATYDGVRAYANAKRAQVVLTQEWGTRATASGVTFHAMHPGWSDTPGLRASLPTFGRLLGPILRTPAEGVDTTLWLASVDADRIGNGHFWLDRHTRRTVYLPWTSTPSGEADRLWRWCVERSAVDDPTSSIAGPRATVGQP